MLRCLLAALACLPLLSAEPILVAHRGSSADAPENTLPAFQLAWEHGADAIEGDFRLTSDGHVVCMHDDTTKRTGDRNVSIAKSTLADLRTLDVGNWKGPRWAGTKIPTLAEVLAIVPADRSLYLEIKSGPEIIPPILAILEQSSLRKDQVTVIAFDQKVIQAFKQAAPDRQAFWLCKIETKNGRTTPSYDSVFATLATIKADALSTNAWPGIDSDFISRLREAGCTHHAWTINDAPTAQKFLALGTSSVTTDRPAPLRKELIR